MSGRHLTWLASPIKRREPRASVHRASGTLGRAPSESRSCIYRRGLASGAQLTTNSGTVAWKERPSSERYAIRRPLILDSRGVFDEKKATLQGKRMSFLFCFAEVRRSQQSQKARRGYRIGTSYRHTDKEKFMSRRRRGTRKTSQENRPQKTEKTSAAGTRYPEIPRETHTNTTWKF